MFLSEIDTFERQATGGRLFSVVSCGMGKGVLKVIRALLEENQSGSNVEGICHPRWRFF